MPSPVKLYIPRHLILVAYGDSGLPQMPPKAIIPNSSPSKGLRLRPQCSTTTLLRRLSPRVSKWSTMKHIFGTNPDLKKRFTIGQIREMWKNRAQIAFSNIKPAMSYSGRRGTCIWYRTWFRSEKNNRVFAELVALLRSTNWSQVCAHRSPACIHSVPPPYGCMLS